jgi:hypothetical protein
LFVTTAGPKAFISIALTLEKHTRRGPLSGVGRICQQGRLRKALWEQSVSQVVGKNGFKQIAMGSGQTEVSCISHHIADVCLP